MDCVKEVLSNGLRVLTIPMSAVESATVAVWVRTGSRFEAKRVNGISHFLEHMVFKGGKRYGSAKILAETVDSLGAENNASTDKEITNYWIKARVGVIEKCFDILSDVVLTTLLKPADIERERGVIAEEIAMYEDLPMRDVANVFESLIFAGEPLGMDVIGTKETVKSVRRDDFVSYKEENYYSENMLVTVAGGVGATNISRLAEKYFGEIPKRGKKPGKPNASFDQKKPQVRLKTKKTDQAHLIMGFRGAPRGHQARYTEAILTTILGGGMSSRIWTEVREKRGLAYAVKTGTTNFMDNGYVETYAGVPLAKVEEAIKVILEEHRKVASIKYQVSSKELKKAKEYLKGHLALSLEDTSDVNAFFGLEELLLEKTRTPEEVFAKIDKVTTDEVTALAKKFFVPKGLNLAVIGPYKSSAQFEKLLN